MCRPCKKDGISISMYRFFDRSRENLSRGGARDYSRDSLGLRDGSEMVVDACVKGKHAYTLVYTSVLCTNKCFCLCFILL